MSTAQTLMKKPPSGNFYIFFASSALMITIICLTVVIGVIFFKSVPVFYPERVVELTLQDGTKLTGSFGERHLGNNGYEDVIVKTGNREIYGAQYRRISTADIASETAVEDVVVFDRYEDGTFIGYWPSPEEEQGFDAKAEKAAALRRQIVELRSQLRDLDDELREIALDYKAKNLDDAAADYRELAANDERSVQLRQTFETTLAEQNNLQQEMDAITLNLLDADGNPQSVRASEIVRYYYPNQISVLNKAGIYAARLAAFLGEWPRKSNTEGGIFPAIIGTFMLVLIMSMFAFPLGLMVAVYLSEYAGNSPLVKVIRIAINNLAGIPSIVFGVFGLGFFVYGIGSSIDELFFAERLPEPTFGTGGILWASLTLSLLTVPVVIVTAEEALTAVPKGMRHASLALGATKLQTLFRVTVPHALPGIITGFILAVSRGAGEVAPLLVTGVVKLAPELPVNGEFPFVQMQNKFMHLGFHIYDLGFQSPDTEASKPLVFMTTLVLLFIVLALNISAIWLRERMRKRIQSKHI